MTQDRKIALDKILQQWGRDEEPLHMLWVEERTEEGEALMATNRARYGPQVEALGYRIAEEPEPGFYTSISRFYIIDEQ